MGRNIAIILYPLWAGSMPALLKGFLEQVFRPGFAMDSHGGRASENAARASS